MVANISEAQHTKLHPDFGGDGEYGIPYIVVTSTQTKVPINVQGDFDLPGNVVDVDRNAQAALGDRLDRDGHR